MPTISQLPPVAQITSADEVPLSQAGVTGSVSVGTLLSAVQPAILTETGKLLGRTSLGTGGPEPVTVGTGLTLNGATLTATGADHAAFAVQGSLVTTDQVVLNSGGHPMLLPMAALRNLFSPGSNIAIDAGGTISATGEAAGIATLPTTTTASSQDLVAISQSGVDCAISYAALIDGQTIDAAQPAAPAQDSDTLWVAQGSSTMVRQNLSALWSWIAGKLPAIKQPVVELSVDTTLDATVHNARILVCSQPLSLQAVAANMGSGFACDVLNMSSGAVTLGGGFVTSSGESLIPPGQSAAVRCVTYSVGAVVYATVSALGGTSSPPATVSGLSVGDTTTTSVALAWQPATGASSYVVQYRVQGSTDWLLACSSVAAVTYTVGGLLPSTVYEFAVTAVNGAGSSPSAATTTATTAATLAPPGQVTGLTAGNITANAIALTWSVPGTGGAVTSYTVQFRPSGTGNWSTASSSVIGTQYSVDGLVPSTTYEFQVSAGNAAGLGAASSIATATTNQATGAVSSITWNLLPSGDYVHGIGTVGVNAHVDPSTAPIQFGFSTSAAVLPSSWVAATYVNSDLWGAYPPTPATAGTWYVWASGTDGSCPTVDPTGFAVS